MSENSFKPGQLVMLSEQASKYERVLYRYVEINGSPIEDGEHLFGAAKFAVKGNLVFMYIKTFSTKYDGSFHVILHEDALLEIPCNLLVPFEASRVE